MAQTTARSLDSGDAFPPMTLALVGGATMQLPDPDHDGWSVLLVYRGHW